MFVAVGVLLALVGSFLAFRVVIEFATRGCSLSGSERSELVDRLNSGVTADALEVVLGPESAPLLLVLREPEGQRDFALDQGPQRVCASGAVLRRTPSGEVNVLVSIYDSSTAARKNVSSNLADAPAQASKIDGVTVLTSEAVCSRSDGDVCLERSAQAVAGSLSVVVKSREMEAEALARAAQGLALQLAREA
jgi:hypothetical protein